MCDNDPINYVDILGLVPRNKQCNFTIIAGHADEVDKERKDPPIGNPTPCDKTYPVGCFTTPNGGYLWPTKNDRDKVK
jgi:hypothetical protein